MNSSNDRPNRFIISVVKIGNVLEHIMQLIGGLCIVVFVGAVLLDVVSRLLHSPMKSCQEIALFAFVWAIFTGSAVAVRRRKHFTIDIVINSFKGVARKVVDIFDLLAVTAFSVVILIYSWRYSIICLKRFSQPSGICMTVGTASMFVGSICMVYFCLEHFILAFSGTSLDQCSAVLEERK